MYSSYSWLSWLPPLVLHRVLMCFFQAVVQEMNRLGIIVDLSHTSWETAFSVLNISRAPVIFSHSSSYSICEHTRNVPDWLLRELVRTHTWIHLLIGWKNTHNRQMVVFLPASHWFESVLFSEPVRLFSNFVDETKDPVL